MLLHENEGVPLVELMVADDEVRVIHLGDEMRVTALLTAATAANSRKVSLSASMNVWADDWDIHKPEGRSRRLPTGEELGATLYELSKGGGIAYHIHHGSEELLIVLEGRLKLRTWMSGNSEMNRP